MDSVDDLLIDNAARYLLKDWKGLVNWLMVLRLHWNIRQNEGSRCLSRIQSCTGRSFAEAASIARVKSSRSGIR